jgi:hypothetical protein
VVSSCGCKHNIDRLVVTSFWDKVAACYCQCGGKHGEYEGVGEDFRSLLQSEIPEKDNKQLKQ